jgi:gamma-glutamyltranspeptidase/glutathione hydrolase
MSDSFSFNSHRSSIYSRAGIVAASQPLAVAAGLRALEVGGTAADAAVATAAALNVTEPGSTGLGGDCFALYFDAKTRSISALNGSGRAPASLSLERLQKEGITALPPYHPYCVTVPGACAGWCDLIERFGRLSLDTILSPAIRYAEEGFPVAPMTAYYWQKAAQSGQLSRSVNGTELTLNGRGPHPGEIFHNPGLARTLRLIAEGGKQAFYQGPVAEAIAAILQEAGGCMSLDDLGQHTSTWEQPISTTYHSIRVWECPPNGQGLAALLALNLLETFDLEAHSPLSPQRLHWMIEAMRLAFADARYYVADPAFHPAPLDSLLSKEYARERRKLILPDRLNPEIRFGTPVYSSDTVYFSVVDGEGNACSFINSNYMGFGTGIVPRGFGFALQNRGHNFNLEPDHPNALAPSKRPYHTIIPAMATDLEGNLYASYGVMGGFMQPQGHMQVTVAMINDAQDPQAALDRPRFCLEGSLMGPEVAMEEGIPAETLNALQNMGHHILPVNGMARSLFGRGQIIRRDPHTGVLWAGSDPRADGCAMSLGF